MNRVLALVPLMAVLAFAQLLTGSAVPAGTALAALAGDADPLSTRIVLEVRAPRVLVGLAAGACLGLAGVLLQATLRNPLASPDVTGVGSGAVLGAVVATTIGGGFASPGATIATALAGGLLGGGVLWAVAARQARDSLRLVVVGVLLSAVLAGATLVLLTARPQAAGSMAYWLIGSLGGRTWQHWAVLWPCLLACLLVALLLSGVLDVLAVDDDHAAGLGLAVNRWRPVVLLVAVAATAAAVSVAGALAFAGLVAPHAARRLCGADRRLALPAAALLGAAVVACADTIAQLVALAVPTADGSGVGVPAGAVTALVGAALLSGVARRESAQATGGRP